MTCTFSPEQISALATPLDRGKVRQREQGRAKVSCLEGWQVTAEANRIFGFDGWQRETVVLRFVWQAERRIGREPSKPSDPPQRDATAGASPTPPGCGWSSAESCGKAAVSATALMSTWARPMNPPSRKRKPMQ
ncbi:Rad52/Rad22 family DNA repair protein [Synechococcus sp. 1G10]|uniref:Rad52/Rad22 family DNA repair protein n=1 Tax=Synechococcus sp. 1G10 TaxID=2025605 RepID=UPI001E65B164|nr:Rad52/Rad22 family DNA repair protein [Synechococcus sp. 1G10]